MRRAIWLTVLTLGCGPRADLPFPEGFVWGSATAGFQVDMGCPTWSDAECVDDASDWYQWVTDPGIVEDEGLYVTGEPVSAGPGMWELFEQDVARMSDDGLTGYRMSLEWSRLFPDAAAASATSVADLDAHADPAAVARYHEQLAALSDADIHPLVTLNHYTLPLWVHDGVACHADWEQCTASGWLDGDRIVPLIALYAGWCAREFGGEIDQWATLNEPFATTLSGFLQPGESRSGPPGISMKGAAVVATIQHQIEAHAAMYDAVHEHDTADADGDGSATEVGIVLNMVAMVPDDPQSADDIEAVAHMDHLYHRVFLDAITDGSWDADLDGTWDTTRPELADRLDYLGINYYNLVTVASIDLQLLPEVPLFDFIPDFPWDPYPEGLAEVVGKAAEYDVPIVITENGTPFTEQSDVVLEDHLVMLQGAIEAGADVRGYYYWSFVDNYEWNHGMAMRFGLYRLDLQTKERHARPVLDRYRTFMKAGGVVLTEE